MYNLFSYFIKSIACGVTPYHNEMSCTEHVENLRAARLQQSNTTITTSSDGTELSTSSGADLLSEEEATLAYLKQSGMRICKKCHGGVVKSGGCDKMKWYFLYITCYSSNE